MQNKQIKSKARVKDKGEVFTNPREVKAMCDLIQKDVWDDIDSTFLEPTCGNGNFLVEILDRKLQRCNSSEDVIRATRSIWAIDIMEDNVDESRHRCLNLIANALQHYKATQEEINKTFNICSGILAQQIICGDSLKIMKEWEEL